MSGKMFVAELPIECEHQSYVVVGKLEYYLPSQVERIGLQKGKEETDVSYTTRLVTQVSKAVCGCDLKIYEKAVKTDTLKQSLKKLDKLKFVEQITDHETLFYYGVYDSVQNVLSRAFATGHEVGKGLRAI